MAAHRRVRGCALALLLASFAVFSQPAAASVEELLRLMQDVNERLIRLERRHAELQRQVEATRANSMPGELASRLRALEETNERIEKGLASDRLSEHEPELTNRLKAVENQSTDFLKAARTVEALEGITAGVSFTTMAQKPFGLQTSPAANSSQLNYRGDVFVTLPLANLGDTENSLFTHFRLGQGNGLNALQAYSRPNATAFRVQGVSQPDDSVAILGQAWYQADIPLPMGGFKPASRQTLQLNFGKMDPFVFFDQNAAANDETRQFVNTAFVHNPLLDAGGDIGVDANGFSPGFRASLYDQSKKPESWRLSLGVFGAGQGANYGRFFSSPFVIVQAESERRLFQGLTGTYRIYAWRNGQAPSYAGGSEGHAGWGVSADQRVDDGITLFGRYGQNRGNGLRFDRALTAGVELNGSYWQRGADAIGMAFGALATSDSFRRDSIAVDADADGVPDFGYAAGRSERLAELYYRYRMHKQFELSPHLQYIAAPGGNGSAPAVKIVGLRAQVGF